MIRCVLFDTPDVEYYWSTISKLLAPMIEMTSDEVSLETIQKYLFQGQTKIIGVFKDKELIAACVLSITIYDTGKKTLQVPHIGGSEMSLWKHKLWDMIKKIAGNIGVSHIRICGRSGWEKLALSVEDQPHKFKKLYTTFEYEV